MVLEAGDLKLDAEHRLLHVAESDPIQLIPKESRLLAILMESPGQVVGRAHLPSGR